MFKITYSIALLLFSTIAFAQYTGRVYVDANKNGQYDKGEKLMKNVSVSDGLNVVKTSADGHYALPGHEREKFIFITLPSGYYTNNAHYKKIESGTSGYDFGIHTLNGRINKNGTHKFIQISDTEIFNTKDHDDWVKYIHQYATNEQAAFIVHTGDICYENGLKTHINLMNTDNMDCPVFYTIGNHDLVKGKYGEELFESIYGPVFFSFDMGNVHYVVTPMLSGDYKPQYTKEDVYRWLRNDLAQVAPGKAVVIFSHDLITKNDQFIYGINDVDFIDLSKHNFKAWIFGHWHINYMKKVGGAFAISTAPPDKGGIDHSTSSYRVMTADSKGNLQSELRYSYIGKSMVINSVANNRAPINADGKIPVSVNVYSSAGSVREVSCILEADGKSISKKIKLQQQTNWNWFAEVGAIKGFEGKSITIKAKAVFINGETMEQESTFIFVILPKTRRPLQRVKTGQTF